MAGDAFASGVRRFGPPTVRPLLPWEAPGLAAFFTPVGSMWFPDPLLVRAGRCPPLPFGSPAPVETADAVAEAGQPVGGRKRTTRKISPAAGETDQGVEEEAKLTQMARWRVVIAIFGNECSTRRQLADLEEEAAQDVLSNIFDVKAANMPCIGGQQYRSREVKIPPRGNGKLCSSSMVVTASCNVGKLCGDEKNCSWGEWTEWGQCSKCGGQKTRHRKIATMPSDSSPPCDVDDAEETTGCPRCELTVGYCVWQEWSPYSLCSSSCGSGT